MGPPWVHTAPTPAPTAGPGLGPGSVGGSCQALVHRVHHDPSGRVHEGQGPAPSRQVLWENESLLFCFRMLPFITYLQLCYFIQEKASEL